jgi:polysaccharide export outer membrane protein
MLPALPLLLLAAVNLPAIETADTHSIFTPILEDMQISSSDSVEVVVFVTSGEGLDCSLQRLENPHRLVLDFPGARNLIRDRALPAGLHLLSSIEIEEIGLGAERRTRAVLLLKHPANAEMARAPGLITLLLRADPPLPEVQDPARAAAPPPRQALGIAEATPAGASQATDTELVPLFLASPEDGSPGAPGDARPLAARVEHGEAQSIGTAAGDTPLGPHDLLFVKVFGVESLDRRARISADGTLEFPLVGEVQASGMTRRELEEEISRRLADGFVRDPEVSVLVEEYRSRRISVSGAVRHPGAFELLGPSTLLEVLALAGGILEDRAADHVLIVRPHAQDEPPPIEVRRGALESGQLEANLSLRPGDLIHVPFEEMIEVLVRGRVRQPDRYRVPASNGVTILQAVMLAGGTPDGGTGRRAEIFRSQQDGPALTLEVDLKRIRDGADPDLPLKANDIVVVH